MKPVTIIANPASGKDIRRLVAHGSVVHSSEKVNIVRRILIGLDSIGVKKVFVMPDMNKLGTRALDRLNVKLEVEVLDFIPQNSPYDSVRAAKLSREKGAGCIIVLGGDGTNRVVAKESQDVPLLPIATGTNNVFSNMVEGTLAGIAAGVVAMNNDSLDKLTRREPMLEIWQGSQVVDTALVDLVVTGEAFVASRALWEVSSLKEVFLTRAEPENIGFSSLGGYLCHLPLGSGKGLHLRIGEGGRIVRAPIGPGLIKDVPIASEQIIEPDEHIPIQTNPAMIALDGEREFNLVEEESATVKLNLHGPLVVEMAKTLRWASEAFLFVKEKGR
jgi:hypothetical protein